MTQQFQPAGSMADTLITTMTTEYGTGTLRSDPLGAVSDRRCIDIWRKKVLHHIIKSKCVFLAQVTTFDILLLADILDNDPFIVVAQGVLLRVP